MGELETALREQLDGYKAKIGTLGDYEKGYIDFAFTELEAKEMTKRERLVMKLLKGHVQSFAEQRRADSDLWLEDFRKGFAEFSDS
jgi:hypothetical protein